MVVGDTLVIDVIDCKQSIMIENLLLCTSNTCLRFGLVVFTPLKKFWLGNSFHFVDCTHYFVLVRWSKVSSEHAYGSINHYTLNCSCLFEAQYNHKGGMMYITYLSYTK